MLGVRFQNEDTGAAHAFSLVTSLAGHRDARPRSP